MKKYTAPTIERVAMATEASVMLSVSYEVSTQPQLSNDRSADDGALWDED